MLLYELTSQAESDIRSIIRYTLEQHGEKQAFHYKITESNHWPIFLRYSIHPHCYLYFYR
jgi:hypothetical protein